MGDAMRRALEDSGPPIMSPTTSFQDVSNPHSLSASPPDDGIHPSLSRRPNLAIANPVVRDGEAQFSAKPLSRCVYNGQPVRKTITEIIAPYFEIDVDDDVDLHYDQWKRAKHSKYYALIHYLRLDGKMNDHEIRAEIVRYRKMLRNELVCEESEVYEEMQCLCEGWTMPRRPVSLAAAMGKVWLHDFCKENRLRCFRTEFTVVYELPDCGVPVAAGRVNLLLQSTVKPNEFTAVNWKPTTCPAAQRTHRSASLLGAEDQSALDRFTQCDRAAHPYSAYPRSDLNKYCAELCATAQILFEQYNIDCGDRMFLVQVSDQLPRANCVRVPRMDTATQLLLADEVHNTILEYSP